MDYTEALDAFYGKDAQHYRDIAKHTSESSEFFRLPYYLTFSPDTFDDLTICEIDDKKHCFIKYMGYQHYVTEGKMVYMIVTEEKKEFIQKICDPKTKNQITYRMKDLGEGVVEVSAEQHRIRLDGNVETTSFDVHLQANLDWWDNLKLGVMSAEKFVEFCIKNSSTDFESGLFSSYGVAVGKESIELVDDKYSQAASHLKDDDIKLIKGSLKSQIEWFNSNHKNKFINEHTSLIYEMFTKIEPRLRVLQKEKEEELNKTKGLVGDNLKDLMKSHRVDVDRSRRL